MSLSKYIVCIALIYSSFLYSQVDANSLMGLPTVTNLTDITGTPNEGNIVYVTSDDRIYRYDGATWIADTGTDNQQLDATNTSFNTTNNQLTIALENGGTVTEDLSSLSDDDWYQENTTTPPTSINNSIYTLGDVGIGLNNPERALHIAGDNSVVRVSRSGNTSSFIFDRYTGTVNNTLKSFLFGLNASAVGTGEFFIADYNENVGGGGFDKIISFTDADNPIKFDQYTNTAPATFNNNSTPKLLGVSNAGDVVMVANNAPRVFYPPSVQIDASVNGTFTLNLYDEYVAQYTGTGIIRSTSGGVAAPDIPIYTVDQLYYYVTFADPAVFSNISIDGDTGIMTYTIVGQPTDFNSLINVVFVVK